jgi:FlaA1/EpsC-like NDP-sugar epimerase
MMRNRYLLASDVVAFALSGALAYTARFEGFDWMPGETASLTAFLGLAIPVRILVNLTLGLYQRVWSLASIAELERIVAAAIASGVLTVLVGLIAVPELGLASHPLPIGVVLLDAFFAASGVALPRIALRFRERRLMRRASRGKEYRDLPGALILGAGAAGQIVARELTTKVSSGFRVVGFLDDDTAKQRRVIGDLRVLGRTEDLASIALATGARCAIIAVPSASGDTVRRLMQLARGAGLETRTVPSLHEQITQAAAVSALRPVRIEDLLQREPVVTDTATVRARVADKVVLVTGAGGSIGSELCRQLASMHPAELVLVGRGENSIFEIQQELIGTHPFVKLTPVILDVRDAERMREVMLRHKPVAVFHAAAHKHVPLMEQNVLEALRNNVLGTKSVVDAALAADVSNLVLISTDKAVRPTSVMGASKRIAEQVVQLAARESGKAYVSVRFGNVLGSRGSVIPTFLKQIAAGGPVMVTHPEMRRYFMTIPEAVQLVLQAYVMGTGEEVFCLDMGEPVKIVHLARDLIELTAADAPVPIEIRFTGVRPGEKLYEELFFGAEEAEPTRHPKLLRSTRAGVRPGGAVALCLLTTRLAESPGDEELHESVFGLVEDYRKELAPVQVPQTTVAV